MQLVHCSSLAISTPAPRAAFQRTGSTNRGRSLDHQLRPEQEVRRRDAPISAAARETQVCRALFIEKRFLEQKTCTVSG